jgi:hypothetical protein
MPSLPIASPKTATAITSWRPKSSSVIHCGFCWLGSTEATHFVPRWPSIARDAEYSAPGPKADEAVTDAIRKRRMPVPLH